MVGVPRIVGVADVKVIAGNRPHPDPSSLSVIEIIVNGENKRVGPSDTVADLVQSLALTGKRIAVERNGEIVPGSRHAKTGLVSGDTIEIVVAVGGG